MKIVSVLICLFFITALFSGCTTVQKGAAVGAAGGAGLGAIIGHQSGHTGEGALIGAGVGALTGALAGDVIEKNKEKEVVKFCPKCGKQFKGASSKYCPDDGTELQLVK